MPVLSRVIGRQGGSQVRIVSTSVQNTVAQTDDRTEGGVAGTAETNDFATNSIFLGRKREGGKGGISKVSLTREEWVQLASAQLKLDIAHTERCRITRQDRVFAGAKKKEKGNAAHVSNCQVTWCGCRVSDEHHAVQDLNGDGFDPVGRRVLSTKGGECALKAKIYFALRGKLGVEVTHTGEHLHNTP